MTRAKNAPRLPVGRRPMPAEETHYKRIVVALTPAQMEQVQTYLRQHTHLAAGTWAREVLLGEITKATQQRSQP